MLPSDGRDGKMRALASRRSLEMIGTTLAHYTILKKLGEGGMGEVYLAQDTDLSRKIALKVLRLEGQDESELLARFQREARAVAALNHPNIVTIHSVEVAPH